MITARRAGPVVTLVVALAGLPGCATIIAETMWTERTARSVRFGGTIIDLLGCCLILPLPLCLADLPLSFVADLVVWLVDDAEHWEGNRRHEPEVRPTPGAPRGPRVPDCFVPTAELTSAVDAGRLRLVAASPGAGVCEVAALGRRGEALLADGDAFEALPSVLRCAEREPARQRLRASSAPGRTSALSLDEADHGLVVDDQGGACLIERSGTRWTRLAPLAGAPRSSAPGDVVAALSWRGTRAAAAGPEGITLWDVSAAGRSGPERVAGVSFGAEAALAGRVTALTFAGDSGLLVGTSEGEVVRLPLAGTAPPARLGRDAGPILALAWQAGEQVVWASEAGVTFMRLQSPPTPPRTYRLEGDPRVVGLSFADDQAVWLAASDGTARLLQLGLGRELDRIDLRGLGDSPLRVAALGAGEVVLVTERGAVLGFAPE